jgi:hypothetical protein
LADNQSSLKPKARSVQIASHHALGMLACSVALSAANRFPLRRRTRQSARAGRRLAVGPSPPYRAGGAPSAPAGAAREAPTAPSRPRPWRGGSGA